MTRVLLVLLVLPTLAWAEVARDPAQVRAFRADHPCPATGKTSGACPGWVVDHDYPLCAGGKDHPSNMRWQKYGDSLAKDRVEVDLCRVMGGAKRLGPLKEQP